MPEQLRVCVDAISPARLRQIGRLETQLRSLAARGELTEAGARAMAPIRTVWPNGSTLRVRFTGGTAAEHTKVAQVAKQWMNHANLRIEFGSSPQAEIRVGFVQDGRSWSYVGTDNLNIPANSQTMNFGWPLDDGTILHEFGHAIGLAHEHQNPQGGIQWNEAVVIRDLSGPPNSWDEDTIRHNVLEKYAANQLRGTAFDRTSIMCYAFPASWTLNNVATPQNNNLSATDKSFVGRPDMYPLPGGGGGTDPVQLQVARDVGVDGEIGLPGEEDLYKFTADAASNYKVETEGPTDVLMRLFGPDSGTALIAEDDDSGEARNARIVRSLVPGEYLVQVRHFNPQASSGKYRITVSR
jgi:hypothetical protein